MKNTRKGFTIVELVIVIAVVAILAAVLIPTFVSLVNKANVANDTALVKNLNTALAADTDGCKTMSEALAAAADFGYDIAKINAKGTNNEILWDSVNNVFCYFNSEEGEQGKITYIPDYEAAKETTDADYWVIASTPNTKYSTYLYGAADGTTVTASNGIDVTACNGINVLFNGTKANIYTNGGNLTINNPDADVYHYGEANEVVVDRVATSSYHVFAKVTTIKIAQGHIVPEAGSEIKVLAVVGTADQAVSITVTEGANVASVIISSDKSDDVKAAIETAVTNVVENIYKDVATNNIENAVTGAALFAGGMGTAEKPYLIETAEQLQNITLNYDNGYFYYQVKDGVAEIDCSEWPRNIYLNGSFDGNGVKLVNLSAALFNKVGYQLKVETVKIANIDVTMNTTTGDALVRNLYNGGETIFENVQIHGYIEGDSNMGSFYKYGTANYDSKGCDYTVTFINSTSDATIVDISTNTPGGMIGHTYHGTGNKVTINLDETSGYMGRLYSTSGNAYNLAAISGTCILNGEAFTATKTACNTLTVIAPTKGENNEWTVEKQNGVSYITVFVTAQIDEYDNQGNVKPNGNGLTITVSSEQLTELASTTKVLNEVTSVEIVNDYLNDSYGYTLENGVLKVYVGNRNALSGKIRIQVAQYDVNGNIVATGVSLLGTVTK